MATKFVAPVIALALLVIASSVGKLSGEKSLLSLCLQKKIRSPGQSNGLGSGACALNFTLCHCQVHVLSHAQCQTLKSRK